MIAIGLQTMVAFQLKPLSGFRWIICIDIEYLCAGKRVKLKYSKEMYINDMIMYCNGWEHSGSVHAPLSWGRRFEYTQSFHYFV